MIFVFFLFVLTKRIKKLSYIQTTLMLSRKHFMHNNNDNFGKYSERSKSGMNNKKMRFLGSAPKSREIYERSEVNDDKITILKKQLEQEKLKVRKLIAEKVESQNENNELKEFLLNAISEVKKEILLRSGVRSLSPPAPGSRKNSTQEKIDVNFTMPTLSAFTNTDKKRAMELLFTNENFVNRLTEQMFPKVKKTLENKPVKFLIRRGSQLTPEGLRNLTASPSARKVFGKKMNYISYKPYSIK